MSAASQVTADHRQLLEFTAFSAIQAAAARMQIIALNPESDPELVLKIANSKLAEIGKTVPEKKADPNAGLRVFNVVFNNGRMQGSVGSADLPMVYEIGALQFLESATPAMLANANINADISDAVVAPAVTPEPAP